MTNGKPANVDRPRDARLVRSEKAPEDCGELGAKAPRRVTFAAFVAGEHVVELLAPDAVGDWDDELEPLFTMGTRVAVRVAVGEVEADLTDAGTVPRAEHEVPVDRRQLPHRRHVVTSWLECARGEALDRVGDRRGVVDDVRARPRRELARPPLLEQRAHEEHRAPVLHSKARLHPGTAVLDASTMTLASVMPDITALRIGNVRRLGGASGQNCETTAPWRTRRRWSGAF